MFDLSKAYYQAWCDEIGTQAFFLDDRAAITFVICMHRFWSENA